jgi:hypothetical protein
MVVMIVLSFVLVNASLNFLYMVFFCRMTGDDVIAPLATIMSFFKGGKPGRVDHYQPMVIAHRRT